MSSSNVFLLLSIAYLTFCGVTSAKEHPKDILTSAKDDCGNVCGVINTNVKDSKCGDSDKRKDEFLLIFDESEKDEEKTEYFELLDYECVKECPKNYTVYKTTKICVKDPVAFEKELSASTKTAPIDDKINSTWWIVGGVAGLLIVAIVIAFIIIRKRSAYTRN